MLLRKLEGTLMGKCLVSKSFRFKFIDRKQVISAMVIQDVKRNGSKTVLSLRKSDVYPTSQLINISIISILTPCFY